MAHACGELDGDHLDLLLRGSIDPRCYYIVEGRLCSKCVADSGMSVE